MLTAIISTANEGIITIDELGQITTANRAAHHLFGYPDGDLPGQNVKLLMPQPYAGEHDGYIKRYIETGHAHIIGIGREVQGKRRDGTKFPIDLSVGEGHTEGRRFFVAIIRDITERHQMQVKLSMTERLAAIGELAAGVAHEINNPINTILNSAQLILDGDEVHPNTEAIKEEGMRIAAIVRDLLQFASGDGDAPQATDLQTILDRTLRLLRASLDSSGIELNVTQTDKIPSVLARPQQLQQVLVNLIINARQSIEQEEGPRLVPARINVHLGEDAGGAVIEVTDSGPGVAEHVKDRIFEPFVTTKRARGGTGLGLSVSHSLIRGFGGSLTLRPANPRGATFRVWLPDATAGA
jgi:PAS domain S-box-containing protein